MKRLVRLTLGVATAALITLGLISTAGAQQIVVNPNCYSNCSAVITIVNINVGPGGTVIINGGGFIPGARVIILGPGGQVLGETIARPDGTISAGIAAPTDPGNYSVTATDGTNSAVADFTVTAAEPVAVAGSLPYTGSGTSLPLAEIGAGLAGLGALVVLSVRKHQAKASA